MAALCIVEATDVLRNPAALPLRTERTAMSNIEEQARGARAEAALTALIARCLLRPSLEFAKEVQGGDVAGRFTEMLSDYPDEMVAAALADLHRFHEEAASVAPNDVRLMLETDYNRLFVGPGRLLAVPYESFYKTMKDEHGRGHLRGPSEQQVVACYGANGFKMPDRFVDFADHIAIELEFLGAMADKEADAILAGDPQRAVSVREAAETFREMHALSWIGEFAHDVRSGAHRVFYPAVVTIAERTILRPAEAL